MKRESKRDPPSNRTRTWWFQRLNCVHGCVSNLIRRALAQRNCLLNLWRHLNKLRQGSNWRIRPNAYGMEGTPPAMVVHVVLERLWVPRLAYLPTLAPSAENLPLACVLSRALLLTCKVRVLTPKSLLSQTLPSALGNAMRFLMMFLMFRGEAARWGMWGCTRGGASDVSR